MKSILAIFLFAATAFASDCNSPVVDNAHVLQGKEVTIITALAAITAKGGDGRVITDDPSITPEQYVAQVQRSCPSWQSANGGVKNNLIVFLVFPQHHKVGLFVGNEFGKAINTSLVRSQFMAPGFKDGDFSRGFTSGINQVAVEMEAFQTAALHPNQTTVTQQPTDYSGLWHWLDGILLLVVFCGMLWLVLYFRSKRQATKDAQQNAIRARNAAAQMAVDNPTSIGVDQFTKLSNSETFNPDTDGLNERQYEAIATEYRNIIWHTVANPPKSTRHTQKYPSPSSYSEPIPTTPNTPDQTVINRTTIINRGYEPSPYIPVPVIVEEPIYREPERHHYSEPSSGSDWGGSSSSSSYDSGSSFSDSSSSSDFSSGSSDFGGGSSDF